jgi:hypothetical protein
MYLCVYVNDIRTLLTMANCIDIARCANVITGTPPTRQVVKSFILAADMNFDGAISFEEFEIVAVLLCEHCAFQIIAHWLVTIFVTPFVALLMFQGFYRGLELDFKQTYTWLEVKNGFPTWVQFIMDEKLLFLILVCLLNKLLLPRFIKIWSYMLRDRSVKTSRSSSMDDNGRSSHAPPSSSSSSAFSSPGVRTLRPQRNSVYDIYSSDEPGSRSSTPTKGLHIITPSPLTPSSSSSSHVTTTTTTSTSITSPPTSPQSYPISYAQFQFVSNKEDRPFSPTSNIKSSSSGGVSRSQKIHKRRATAPAEQLRSSLPESPGDSPSGRPRTPTVFKKIRDTFRKKEV